MQESSIVDTAERALQMLAANFAQTLVLLPKFWQVTKIFNYAAELETVIQVFVLYCAVVKRTVCIKFECSVGKLEGMSGV